MKYKIFWCKTNKFFLNKRLNFFANKKDENAIIITSCVVTDNAKKKFIYEIRHSLKTFDKVYFTWCWAFDRWKKIAEKKFFSDYPELQKFSDKIELLWESPDWNFLYKNDEKNFKNDEKNYWIQKIFDSVKKNFLWKNFSDQEKNYTTKKFIVIQNWCDSKCSFCLTISKRWKHRSRPIENIIQEILDFEKNWWKEIVITWINLAAYWAPNTNTFPNPNFANYIEKILEKTSIPRIKISSIWPEFLDEKFFKVVENERILPHFHFSIQSFSDEILKKMYRHYSEKKLDEILTKIRNLNHADKEFISIWADLIVWFPWESEKDFQKTLNWIEKYWITQLHAFPFSPHFKWDNVPAWTFENQIDEKIKKERMQKISETWEKVREKFLQKNKWTKKKVLVEGLKKWYENRFWRTENYIQIELNDEICKKNWLKKSKLKKGEIVEIVI